MAEIVGIKELRKRLNGLIATSLKKDRGGAIVGYTANYALWVHENVEMKWKGKPRSKPSKGKYWDPQGRGQSKFLEQPAREKTEEMSAIVVKALKGGARLQQALVLAGLFLQRESQKLVPVDTGNLKASAFTRKD